MNSNDLAAFNEAVKLAQEGNKEAAYQKLSNLYRMSGVKEVNLFLWLAFTTSNLEEAESYISMAETAAPGNQNVASARLWVNQEKAKRSVQVPPPPFFPAPDFQSQAFQAQPVYQTPVSYPVPQQTYIPYGQQPYYYQTNGRKLSRVTLFGYFLLYFIGCAALFGLVCYMAYLATPTEYYTYYSRTYSYKSGNLVSIAAVVLVLGSSIWACIDASSRRTKYGSKAASNPFAVLLICLFCWMLLFPGYLTQRRRSMAEIGS
ncbi:MAG TPA: hypothetical protein VH186_38460 [Chloroflexia bacterium]|nr:hypothetical protein [Chloroflexia bacterium]